MTSDADVHFDRFNKVTDEFLSQLTHTFPDVSTFAQFKTGFSVLKTLTKRQPQSIFNTYVAIPYKPHILAQDEQFFLNENYDISSDSKDYWQGFVDTLRQLWKNLDDSNKAVIWQYFKVLVTLNDKCLGS